MNFRPGRRNSKLTWPRSTKSRSHESSKIPLLLLRRRVFFSRLFYHLIEPAGELHSIAFIFHRDGAPHQFACLGVSQIQDERAFRIVNRNAAAAESTPTR